MEESQLTVIPNYQELVRQQTDIAGLCKEFALKASLTIDKKKYVRVEGWQSIATAHGCVASATDVRKVDGGICATGEIRRMSDGQLIATAEGFIGEDEPTWYGGEMMKAVWENGQKTDRVEKKTLLKRPEYAIRAMAQTRAISRVCRSCFAHVVLLMDVGLSTTPAEEVPEGGFGDKPPADANTSPTSTSKPREEKQAQATLLPEEEIWTGNVFNVEVAKTGTRNGNEWKLYAVLIGDEKSHKRATTFSDSIQAQAKILGERGELADAKVKRNGKGGFDLISIAENAATMQQ